MRLEKIKTQGLAHLSYFLSADGEAAVIDPRRLRGLVAARRQTGAAGSAR